MKRLNSNVKQSQLWENPQVTSFEAHVLKDSKIKKIISEKLSNSNLMTLKRNIPIWNISTAMNKWQTPCWSVHW